MTYADLGEQMDEGVKADFTYDAISLGGAHESGSVELTHVVRGGGD